MTDHENSNLLLAQQTAHLDTLRRLDEVNAHALDGLDRPNLGPENKGLLARMGMKATEASQPDPTPINLTARRQELYEAHAAALHQVHYLEGAINEIDYLLELTTPQPADPAEGDKT